MKLNIAPNTAIKPKLSTTLRNSFLPILESNISDVEDTLKNIAGENPFVEIKSGLHVGIDSKINKKNIEGGGATRKNATETIESTTLFEESLYMVLQSQIDGKFFPTPKSQDIAYAIIENINSEGYFEADNQILAEELGVSEEEIERVRGRFSFLEPRGVGAKNVIESFIFQLSSLGSDEIEDNLYDFTLSIIKNLDQHSKFKNELMYQDAMNIIRRFKNPPAIEYFEKEIQKIPDIFVLDYEDDDGNKKIEIRLNDEFYPSIIINKNSGDKKIEDYVKTKMQEARNLVDALDMRKKTIKKIGSMILQYQYDFFNGGNIKPMKLKDIAEEFGHAQSTISRAIKDKYLHCNRGTILIKDFFTTAVDDGDTSNSTIKNYISDIVKTEDKKKPLSDLKLLSMVEKHFQIKMVRRTITKYRQQLNIASSNERKRLYALE